jgi:subtilisin family serine protease
MRNIVLYIFTLFFFLGCGTQNSSGSVSSFDDSQTKTITAPPATILDEEDPLSNFQWHLSASETVLSNYAYTVIGASSVSSAKTGSGQSTFYATLPTNPSNDFSFAKKEMDIHNTKTSYQGEGIKIAIVDTGIEQNHPDLSPNIDTTLSIRFGAAGSSSDSSPDTSQRSGAPTQSAHGTCCAGIAAAASENGIGIKGVAPKATLVGINAFSHPTALTFIKALLHENEQIDIYSNSWGDVPGGISPGELDAIKTSALEGRDGKGSIFLFAAGNERKEGANANYYQELNSKYVLTIAALQADGKVASYSNPGANIIAASFGGGTDRHTPTIVTTDLMGTDIGYDVITTNSRGIENLSNHLSADGNENGDYTYSMNGTSAACPMAAGVVALMLEANPNLTLRDIRYILAHTATQYNTFIPIDSTARRNGARLLFSHDVGFGGINTDSAIEMAKNFTLLGPEIVTVYYPPSPPEALIIPPGDQQIREIDLPFNFIIEYVDINISIHHQKPGDLELILTSPSGMQSYLSTRNGLLDTRSHRDIFENFHFGSNAFMDEESQSTSNKKWSLTIQNYSSNESATLKKFQIRINGRNL